MRSCFLSTSLLLLRSFAFLLVVAWKGTNADALTVSVAPSHPVTEGFFQDTHQRDIGFLLPLCFPEAAPSSSHDTSSAFEEGDPGAQIARAVATWLGCVSGEELAQPADTTTSSEWERHETSEGREYYYNSKTRESVWELPASQRTSTRGGTGEVALYAEFAANGGNVFGTLARANARLRNGDCPAAFQGYRQVAEVVAVRGMRENEFVDPEPRVRLGDVNSNERVMQKRREKHMLDVLYGRAAEGDPAANTAMGLAALHGVRGARKNVAEAVHYLTRAAAKGDAEAAAQLGSMYLSGEGMEQDFAEARRLFEFVLHETGKDGGGGRRRSPIATAYNGLGMLHFIGAGGLVENEAQAYEYFRQGAKLGNKHAHFNAGLLLYQGRGVRSDLKSVIEHWQVAATAHHLQAMYNLALLLFEGEGVQKSCTGAVQLLKVVAEEGPWKEVVLDAERLWEEGKVREAFLHYAHAGFGGYYVGQYNAAFLLGIKRMQHEMNLNVDERRLNSVSIQMMRRAAEQGDAEASRLLGDALLRRGALVAYNAAYKKGSAHAAFNIGWMHHHGIGLEQDFELAKRNYELALIVGVESKVPVKIALQWLRLQRACASIPWLRRMWNSGQKQILETCDYLNNDLLVELREDTILVSLVALLISLVLIRSRFFGGG